MPWAVKRHGGRAADQWRDLFNGDEEQARAVYDRERRKLRQGTVRLYNPDGALCLSTSAPRLRSIW